MSPEPGNGTAVCGADRAAERGAETMEIGSLKLC
jgi:hypothetical protein